MKVEEVKKIADEQIEKLVEALSQGKSEALRSYLSAMSKLYKYSFRNMLLILSQRPDATNVAGFKTWKKLGRWVRKGEKGITIIVPLAIKKAEGEFSEDEQMLIRFKASHVFDVSQTDGEALPELAKASGDPRQHLDALKALIAAHNVSLEYASYLDGADGMSRGGAIVLKSELDRAEEFSVLVHEFAHELLHQGEKRGDKNKLVRETEAEAVASVVSEAIGISATSSASDYIQLYQGDVETLKASLDAIQKVATTILTGIFPEA